MTDKTAYTKSKAYSQAEVQYTQLSTTANQACANCRWFGEGGYCHIVEMHPLDIRQTGHCTQWSQQPTMSDEETLLGVILDEADDLLTVAAIDDKAANETGLTISATPNPNPDSETKTYPVELQAAAKDKGRANLWESFRNLFGLNSDHKEALHTSFKVINDRWFGMWSNNVQDRDGEWFSAKAITDYVNRVQVGIVPLPELQVWHKGKPARIGQAQYINAIGDNVKVVYAVGVFDATPQAQRAKHYYATTKRPHGMSHGFEYDRDSFRDNTYHAFNTFELSVLPLEKAANPFTSFESYKEHNPMTDEEKQYLKEVFGAEHAETLTTALTSKAQQLEALGAMFKDFSTPDATSDTPDVTEAVANADKNLKAGYVELVGDVSYVAEQLTTLANAVKQLQADTSTRMAALEADNKALRAKLGDAPRVASQEAATQVDDKDLPPGAKNAMQKYSPIWGETVRE